MIGDSPEQLIIDFGVEVLSLLLARGSQSGGQLFLDQVMLPDLLIRSLFRLFVNSHPRVLLRECLLLAPLQSEYAEKKAGKQRLASDSQTSHSRNDDSHGLRGIKISI